MSKDQLRKFLLTINNPLEHGFTHEEIKNQLNKFKSLVYWCMGDEIGHEEHTPHTHVYIQTENGVRFETVKKRFPTAHIDKCNGTPEENRDYVFKDGLKYNKDEETGEYEYVDTKGKVHKGVHDDDTNEEYGECPKERRGQRNDLNQLYGMIKDGMTTYEILEACPQYIKQYDKIDKVRQTVIEAKYRDTWRDLKVTYIWGLTGAGKTRTVMETYGYSNVYRVTDYQHPFDAYKGQDVVVFEEFRSSLPIDDMLKYLDGYPVEFPARYNNKQACFTKVYIITNIDLRHQYRHVQEDNPMTWDAFLRRIHKVAVFTMEDVVEMETRKYLKEYFPFLGKTPFDDHGVTA